MIEFQIVNTLEAIFHTLPFNSTRIYNKHSQLHHFLHFLVIIFIQILFTILLIHLNLLAVLRRRFLRTLERLHPIEMLPHFLLLRISLFLHQNHIRNVFSLPLTNHPLGYIVAIQLVAVPRTRPHVVAEDRSPGCNK